MSVTRFSILVRVADEYYTLFSKGAQTPDSTSIVIKKLYPDFPERIFLFNKDDQRVFRFATVPLTRLPEVQLRYPLEVTFRIDRDGTLTISWGAGSASVVYDQDVFIEETGKYTPNEMRRDHLRL